VFDLDPGRDLAQPLRVARVEAPSRRSGGAVVVALVLALVVVTTRRR
jgi:hypothetical protein